MRPFTGFSYIILFFLSFITFSALAQFPPGVGHPGTTAMYMDSSAFIGWAKSCQVTRGFVNIADTTITYNGSNRASYGTEDDALRIADNTVISLGDGGSAILTFDNPIINGPGFDFAVFENSIDGAFLELGFVEVSSDGMNFTRFPATSNTQNSTQIGTFGATDPTRINNFAGKYQVMYGTPFDLDTLKGTAGLDINNITHVRITDVVGNIAPGFATHDSQGNIVNDPWPTPFNTCGFDLDAVGVINDIMESIPGRAGLEKISICPNPVKSSFRMLMPAGKFASFTVADLSGIVMLRMEQISNGTLVDCSLLQPGIYVGTTRFADGTTLSRKIIKL